MEGSAPAPLSYALPTTSDIRADGFALPGFLSFFALALKG